MHTQQFRKGYFEAVSDIIPVGNEKGPVLPGAGYEGDVNKFLGAVRGELQRYGVSQEMVVFLSLTGADVVKMSGRSNFGHTLKAFDRRDVLIPSRSCARPTTRDMGSCCTDSPI